MIKYNAPLLEREVAQIHEMRIYKSEDSDYVLRPKGNRGSRMNSTIL
jgi:hypothetical protein